MSKATEDALSALHGTVAKVLTAQLTYEDEPVSFGLDGAEGGGELRYSATPATIAAAIKFLKDNGIEALPVDGSALFNLVDGLPFDTDSLQVN